jgi:hypothetical protein
MRAACLMQLRELAEGLLGVAKPVPPDRAQTSFRCGARRKRILLTPAASRPGRPAESRPTRAMAPHPHEAQSPLAEGRFAPPELRPWW